MPKIKFSHVYQKLLDQHGKSIETAVLLGVHNIRLEEQHQTFLDYDTDNGVLQMPDRGEYLMLLFLKPAYKNLFTTLRYATPEKEEYYRNLIGQKFEIVLIKEEEKDDPGNRII
jgi:hypothetical protein